LIKPAAKIPTVKPSDELGASLEKVKSSHDPIFVFKKGNLEGLLSASHALFKKRFPLKTKVEKAMVKSPKITEENSLFDVAKHMVALKTYTLPIFDSKKKIIGVVSVSDIIKSLKNEKELLKTIKLQKVIFVSMHDKVRDVYNLLRKEKTSRVLVVDSKGKMLGLITRHDLQKVFTIPPARGRSTRNKNNRTFVIDDKDLKKFDFPVSEYMNTHVITLPDSANSASIIKKMNAENVNSIVLVTNGGKPKGIVSVKNILEALSKAKPKKMVNFSLTDHHRVLLDEEKEKIKNLAENFAEKIGRSKPVRSMKAEVSAYYNKKSKITGFEFHFHTSFKNGNKLSAQVEDKVLWNAVKKSMQKVQHQLKRAR